MAPPAVGTLSYNGISFGATSKVSVSIRAVQDDARRTVIYHELKLRVEDTFLTRQVAYPDGKEDVPQRMRYRLLEQGKRLVIKDRGLGHDIDISGSQDRDVKFGPKPEMLTWEPVGNNQSFFCVWECTVHLTPDDRRGVSEGILAFNYDQSYDIDEAGFTVRTISGSLQIAASLDGNYPSDSVDRYAQLILIACPVGYQRRQQFNVSADKTKLDFTITDTQIRTPNVYPPYITRIKARHRASRSRGRLSEIQNNISISLDLAPNVPRREYAWAVAQSIARARIDDVRRRGLNVVVTQIDAEEELYDFQASFNFQYRILAALGDLVDIAGLFQPIRVWYDWNGWIEHMNELWNGGQSQLNGAAQFDKVVNLTDQQLPIIFDFQNPPPSSGPTERRRFCNPRPPQNESWIYFKGRIRVLQDGNPIAQVPLQTPYAQKGTTDLNDTPKRLRNEIVARREQIKFETMAGTATEVVFEGRAARVGWEIPKPRLDGFGGTSSTRNFVPKDDVFESAYVATWFCQPVYAAQWRLSYLLDNTFDGEPGSNDEASVGSGDERDS